jgi:hypothetical protein
MHSTEESQLGPCTSCGTLVSPQDRPYAFGEDELLCYACAIARNGVYDEAHDRWAPAPYVSDLLARALER